MCVRHVFARMLSYISFPKRNHITCMKNDINSFGPHPQSPHKGSDLGLRIKIPFYLCHYMRVSINGVPLKSLTRKI